MHRACSRFPIMSLSAGSGVRMATAMLLFCCIVVPLPAPGKCATRSFQVKARKNRPRSTRPPPARRKKPARRRGKISRWPSKMPPASRTFRMRASSPILKPISCARCRHRPAPGSRLSSGGADGAFGAGVLAGLAEVGKRPDFTMVTGVSTGALMAPFVFLGAKYDGAVARRLHDHHRGRHFRTGRQGRELLRHLAAEGSDRQTCNAGTAQRRRRRTPPWSPSPGDHDQSRCRTPGGLEYGRDRRQGRRQGAQTVSRYSARREQHPRRLPAGADRRRSRRPQIPGNARRWRIELSVFHRAGSRCSQTNSSARLPATDLYVIINTTLGAEFSPTDRDTISILDSRRFGWRQDADAGS